MWSQHNEQEKKVGDMPFTNVYVKNFGEDMTEDQLGEMFERFGRITSLRIMRKEDGKSRGFGFVAFDNPDSAKAAVEELNGKKMIDSKPIYVGRAQNKAERQQELKSRNLYQGANLYVKYLDDTIDEERLRKEFAPFGTITSAKVMLENGCSKGFGFVCFSSPDEATKAITEMNGRFVGTKPLYVALAQRKEDRRTLLTEQYMHHMIDIHLQLQMDQFLQTGSTSGYFVPTSPPPVHPRFQTGSKTYAADKPNSYQAAQQVPNQDGAMCGNISVPPPIAGQQLPNSQDCPSGSRLLCFEYTKNVCNPVQTLGIIGAAPVQQAVHNQGQEPLTSSTLAALQKQRLAEHVYRHIRRIYPDLAGRILGLLQDIHYSVLFYMIVHNDFLEETVEKAIAVLQAQQTKLADTKMDNKEID